MSPRPGLEASTGEAAPTFTVLGAGVLTSQEKLVPGRQVPLLEVSLKSEAPDFSLFPSQHEIPGEIPQW